MDNRQLLARVLALPITTWNYKAQAPEIRHLGPMAQDFFDAFHLGEGDTTISSVDIDGVNGTLSIVLSAQRRFPAKHPLDVR